ncbi:MAG TPA: ParA family protein [Bellilinea sp.]|nr:ParA family protein [Bellilinea sp.]
MIYTLVNQKGGVGKTTTAISLAANLAIQGLHVLLVDLDPQANATSSLNIDKQSVDKGIYEALVGEKPIQECLLTHPDYRITIVPSSPSLAGAEIELISMDKREFRLKELLADLSESYDYILIDCPPSLSLLTVNGLVAAKDGVIIPVQCEYLALEGLGQLMETINQVRFGLFPELAIRGVLMTMYDGRTRLANDVVNEVKSHFQDKVFNTLIPRNIRLAEAPSFGMPITAFAPDSLGAKSYEQLVKEIIEQDTRSGRLKGDQTWRKNQD